MQYARAVSDRVNRSLRLPPDVDAALVERTTTNDLSVNETIVRMLRFALAAQGSTVKIVTTATEEWVV